MEGRNIIHRDLKPENVLLSFDLDKKNPDAYIADFGFACELQEHDESNEIYGTPGYLAPEVLRGETCTFKSDIFSIGSIIFNIVTGAYLFKGTSVKEVLYKNKKCDVAL